MKSKFTLGQVKKKLRRYFYAVDQNKPLPRIWFFAVGNDRIIQAKYRPNPTIRILAPIKPLRLDFVEYRLVEINECDRVAVYK